jgi:hypothetical protein
LRHGQRLTQIEQTVSALEWEPTSRVLSLVNANLALVASDAVRPGESVPAAIGNIILGSRTKIPAGNFSLVAGAGIATSPVLGDNSLSVGGWTLRPAGENLAFTTNLGGQYRDAAFLSPDGTISMRDGWSIGVGNSAIQTQFNVYHRGQLRFAVHNLVSAATYGDIRTPGSLGIGIGEGKGVRLVLEDSDLAMRFGETSSTAESPKYRFSADGTFSPGSVSMRDGWSIGVENSAIQTQFNVYHRGQLRFAVHNLVSAATYGDIRTPGSLGIGIREGKGVRLVLEDSDLAMRFGETSSTAESPKYRFAVDGKFSTGRVQISDWLLEQTTSNHFQFKFQQTEKMRLYSDKDRAGTIWTEDDGDLRSKYAKKEDAVEWNEKFAFKSLKNGDVNGWYCQLTGDGDRMGCQQATVNPSLWETFKITRM